MTWLALPADPGSNLLQAHKTCEMVRSSPIPYRTDEAHTGPTDGLAGHLSALPPPTSPRSSSRRRAADLAARRHALAHIGYLAQRAKGRTALSRDGTQYGRSRTSLRSFFVHHTQRIAYCVCSAAVRRARHP